MDAGAWGAVMGAGATILVGGAGLAYKALNGRTTRTRADLAAVAGSRSDLAEAILANWNPVVKELREEIHRAYSQIDTLRAELNTERESRLLSERQRVNLQEKYDSVVTQMRALEAERDGYKAKVDELTAQVRGMRVELSGEVIGHAAQADTPGH